MILWGGNRAITIGRDQNNRSLEEKSILEKE